ncbi:MAG: CapA family protein [Actinobacteria bacterium]|nr:CapA family protein [Actinomycetota bacterium]
MELCRFGRVLVLGATLSISAGSIGGCGQLSASTSDDGLSVVIPAAASADMAESPQALPARQIAEPADAVVPETLTHTPRTLTITGSGDILIHPSLAAQAAANGGASDPDFAPLLADVKPLISKADYSICHAETPFSPPGYRQPSPHYYVHPNLATGIKAGGFDDCSIASNWTFDKGIEGVRRTIKSLNSAGVNQAGAAANPRAQRVAVRDVNGIRVAHLSYTDPGDSPGVQGSEWAVNRQTPAEIAADARLARDQGAEIVVVSLAMGEMGSVELSGSQKSAAKTITAGGDVDYVIGHGSHTVQPAQKFNDTWVVWHGNLISSFFPDQTRMLTGLVSGVTFTEVSDGHFDVTSLEGYPVASSKGTSARSIDIVRAGCGGSGQYASQWQMIVDAESKAIALGMQFPEPCK